MSGAADAGEAARGRVLRVLAFATSSAPATSQLTDLPHPSDNIPLDH